MTGATGPQVPVIELREWERRDRISVGDLSDADRRLGERLSQGEGQLTVEELRDGIRLSATSWIGVVRFESFEVRVVPKHVGGDLGVLEMLDYASGLNALSRLPVARRLALEGASLLDLIAWLLTEECDRIVRDGLLQDYVTHEEMLPMLRGRLRMADQMLRRFGRLDQLECLFDELETDILENKVLAYALGTVRQVSRHEAVRARASRLHQILSEACDPGGLDVETAERDLWYHRRNEHYRIAHRLALLLLRRLAIRDPFAAAPDRSFAFLIDMNRLFEDFVTQLLRDAFAGTSVAVRAQPRDRTLVRDDATGRPYAAAIPDVLLEWHTDGVRRRIPVDAKYKLYDEQKLQPGDVYQTFFYAYAYSRRSSESPSSAFILYPGSSTSPGTRLRVQDDMAIQSVAIRALPVDVPQALAAIRESRVRQLDSLVPLRAAVLTSLRKDGSESNSETRHA